MANIYKETFNFYQKIKKVKYSINLKMLIIILSKIIHNNDLLMIKGSNATGLNEFSKSIKKGKISVI